MSEKCEKVPGTHKRTRSEKGCALDEMKNLKSPSAKLHKPESSTNKKTKVCRKIVFKEGNNPREAQNDQVNNNSNVKKVVRAKDSAKNRKGDLAKAVVKGKTSTMDANKCKKDKIIDPCFRNVWRKEVLQNHTRANNVNNSEFQEEGKDPNTSDGIVIDVEGCEDLDYVDDVIDEEDLNEYEEVEGEQVEIQVEVLPLSPGATSKTGNGNSTKSKSTKMQQSSGKQSAKPSTSLKGAVVTNQQKEMTVEEIAKLPRVKNLFNKFWEEKMRELNKSEKQTINKDFVKSLSDTTIYAPALMKSPQTHRQLHNELTQNSNKAMTLTQVNKIGSQETERINNDMDNMVSDFVDAIRIEQRQSELDQLQEKERRMSSSNNDNNLEMVKSRVDRTVIEAEKFRANVANPDPGKNYMNSLNQCGSLVMQPNLNEQYHQLSEGVNAEVGGMDGQIPQEVSHIPNIGTGVSDDNFFHLTCHIDPLLIHKIERGEFVELEKLLPKDKLGGKQEENRLEWVQRDGGTFLVPAQKDSKISSFRHWEQVFRAYATIYCGANPHRSKEIWRYITVINTAAGSYLWDNMYNYDITFRHLMAFNPNRSWAVTYNQMWNLSMRDPIPRNGNQKFNNTGVHYANQSFNTNNDRGASHAATHFSSGKKKSDYCWNFNKGVPCKFWNKCKFIERCKYCGSPLHGVNSCQRLLKKLENTGSVSNKPVQETKGSDMNK